MGVTSLAARSRGNFADISFIPALSAGSSSPPPTGIEMNRLIRPVTWIAAIAVTLVLLGAAAARRRAPVASSAPPPPEVSVVTVVPETVTARYEYVGQAEASRRVEVRALVTGVIVARPYVEGTDVAAGTLLFPVDPTTYDAAYRSAQARPANADPPPARLKSPPPPRAGAPKNRGEA